MNLLYTAKSWKRTFAYFVDQFLLLIILSPLYFKQILEIFRMGELRWSIGLLVSAWIVYFLYQFFFLYFFSATPGKALLGLKVVNNNEGVFLKGSQIFLRSFSHVLITVLGFALVVPALYRLDRRHFADWIAETKVVQSTPRVLAPTRHWIWAAVLFIYFFNSALVSLYSLVQMQFLRI
jgi:uncharacterized RDD family membrane protein YckC